MLGKVTGSVVGGLALVGAWVVHGGAVRVVVDEQEPGGHHVHLFLPAALVPVGLEFVPDQKLRGASAELHPWLSAIQAASQELASLPDSDLVEVREWGQHVRINTRGARLVIDVESPGERVHVSFPLWTMDRVARKLESLGPAS
jgi:hypothetical protein